VLPAATVKTSRSVNETPLTADCTVKVIEPAVGFLTDNTAIPTLSIGDTTMGAVVRKGVPKTDVIVVRDSILSVSVCTSPNVVCICESTGFTASAIGFAEIIPRINAATIPKIIIELRLIANAHFHIA